MKQCFCTVLVLTILISCVNKGNKSSQYAVVDIEKGLQNLTELKVSDFGKTIRYIPLETTDDGLVGKDPIIKVLTNHIVVEAQRSCLLFDKKDGRFIASIGHFGQDPAAYTDIFSWTDEKEEFLYFSRQPNQLVKYDMKGDFCGKVEFSSSPGLASYYLLTETEIIGYYQDISQTKQFVLGIFNKEGELIDTVPILYPREEIVPDEIAGILVYKRSSVYGNWAGTGLIHIKYKNDSQQINAPTFARIWKNRENIRFKEDFVDTLYTLSGNQLIPYLIFDTGKYHWPVQERKSAKNSNVRIFMSDVSENENFIFFQCIKGLYADEQVLYNGLYNKQTGVTKMSENSKAIKDDLTQFMPFIPTGISTSGEFVSLLEAYKISEWLEEHPKAKDNKQLSFLKDFNEDMNPVVVVIE